MRDSVSMKFAIPKLRSSACIACTALVLAGCSTLGGKSEMECMERAMYFESHRSNRDGLIAVGSVVMNRVESSQFPDTVCGVVGQKGQFASGVLSRPMSERDLPKVREAARAVLGGERHPLIGNAMFFHNAQRRFSYGNMHYVLVTGGNAFYEKRRKNLVTQPVPPPPIEELTGR